jgi:endonuclease/exonuclease/phosphatase family metal-dependent hydrolase
MQWNMHGCSDLTNQINHIKSVDADVVSVNECRSSSLATIARELAKQTGKPWVSDWLDRGDGDGAGFLTRLSYTRSGILRMADFITYKRVALAGRFHDSSSGKSVTFITTHLVAPESVESGSTEVRFKQARELVSWAAQFEEPRLMAGDMNEDRRYADALDTEIIPYYFDGWEQAVKLEASTGTDIWTAEYPDGRTRPSTRLDYIFYSMNSGAALKQFTVWPMVFSDHRAVSAVFEFR